MEWVEANCEFSQRTANDYIRAADQIGRGLPISSLNKLLKSDRAAKPIPAPHFMGMGDMGSKYMAIAKLPNSERVLNLSLRTLQAISWRGWRRIASLATARAALYMQAHDQNCKGLQISSLTKLLNAEKPNMSVAAMPNSAHALNSSIRDLLKSDRATKPIPAPPAVNVSRSRGVQ